jgi:hypothetical protein
MKFRIEIEMDGAAFENPNEKMVTDCTEIRAILERLLERQINGDNILVGEQRRILDTNGNTCGYWEVSE